MSQPSRDDGDRRQFLGQLVLGAAALATASYAQAQPGSPAHRHPDATALGRGDARPAGAAAPETSWDLSWINKLTGDHRQVFDAPEISDGTVLHNARTFYANFHEVYNLSDADLRAVLVIRHAAIPMVLADPIWSRYDFIGKKMTKLKDPTTGQWTRRNPFLNAKADDKYTLVVPDGSLDALIGRGAIVLGCNMALMHFAGMVAKQTKQQPEAVQAEFKASLVPGVTLVPSGIFGVIRAQEGGCHYLRATG